MAKYKLIFYDAETTDLPQYEDRKTSDLFSERSIFDVHIIEIAAYDPKTGKSFTNLSSQAFQFLKMLQDSHIGNEMVELSPNFSIVEASFVKWISNHLDNDKKLR